MGRGGKQENFTFVGVRKKGKRGRGETGQVREGQEDRALGGGGQGNTKHGGMQGMCCEGQVQWAAACLGGDEGVGRQPVLAEHTDANLGHVGCRSWRQRQAGEGGSNLKAGKQAERVSPPAARPRPGMAARRSSAAAPSRCHLSAAVAASPSLTMMPSKSLPMAAVTAST